jgi:flagellar protein FliO/FliZ
LFLDPDLILKSAGALAAVALPLWLGARAFRGGRTGRGAGRRLAVEEALALDARRRLLLVRCDGREVLLLTGGGQEAVIGWLPERTAP